MADRCPIPRFFRGQKLQFQAFNRGFMTILFHFFVILCENESHNQIQDNNEYKNPKKVWKWIQNELNCQNNNFSFDFLHVLTRKSKVVCRKTFNYGSKSAKMIFFVKLSNRLKIGVPLWVYRKTCTFSGSGTPPVYPIFSPKAV